MVTKSNMGAQEPTGPLGRLGEDIHTVARNKGWWIHERSFGDIAALLHSEIAEAFEEYRSAHRMTEVYAGDKHYMNPDAHDFAELETLAENGVKPEGIGVELADVIIRILDYAEKAGLDMDRLVNLKTVFNRTRPYRHGNKVL